MRFELNLPRDPLVLRVARFSVDVLEGQIDPGALERARLAVDELVTRALRAGSDGTVDLLLEVHPDRLRIEVTADQAGHADGGRGPALLDRVTERWGHVPSGGAVTWWCELNRFGTGGMG